VRLLPLSSIGFSEIQNAVVIMPRRPVVRSGSFRSDDALLLISSVIRRRLELSRRRSRSSREVLPRSAHELLQPLRILIHGHGRA
jgi:hypothetical protein